MRARMTTLSVLLVASVLAGCGGGGRSAAPGTTTAIAVAPADRPACALLFARLKRVTLAIKTSSELIAHSLNKRQLSRRIAIEQVQLERSATLMSGGPIPAPLVSADRRLVTALRVFSRDFARARKPAARGDFQAVAAAMTDPPVEQQILRASKTIEDACT
jgi:hypothetical protein